MSPLKFNCPWCSNNTWRMTIGRVHRVWREREKALRFQMVNNKTQTLNFIFTNKKCEKVSLCDYQDAAIDSADVAQRCRRSLDFERRFSCNQERLLIFFIDTILRTQSLNSVPESTLQPNIYSS